MGQNALLSCKRSDFFDSLMASVTENWPHVGRLATSVESKLNEYGLPTVRPYFLLYTLPVLEISGLLESGKSADRDLWARVQTMMGVHLRYLDNVIDADVERNVAIMHLLSSHRLLSEAKNLLIDRDLQWRPCQDDIYGQFLAFECENQSGFNHDFDSLWRRVSPLCVVPETYLSSTIPDELRLTYKDYLAWSLIQADCDDSLKDLRAACNTPVTRALRASTTGVYLDWQSSAEVIKQIKSFLQRRFEVLTKMTSNYPVWNNIVLHAGKAFVHEES